MPELYEALDTFETDAEALSAEKARAAELHALGYAVYRSHGKPLDLPRRD